MSDARPLEGRIACVTGAGRGIGRAIALAYARAGAAVGCLARSRDEIEATVADIERDGGSAYAWAVDVRDAAGVDGAFAKLGRKFGGLDLLVINAGTGGDGARLADSDPDAWRAVIDVNLVGAFHCARAAVPLLRGRDGAKILCVGSGLGHRGLPGASAYAASKAGLWMLVRVLAQELAEDGISVNELIPGPVETAMSDGRVRRDAASEWLKSPEDVVPLALFLAAQPQPGPTAQSFSLMRRDG